ncbi:hypothetical protein Salat_1130700 [Sesamum alatum]|uniref:Uncharacterized protein n=1 Tax=Sesamum alatum TaxID=300844 RepID=A0AAE1YEB6_9LAMI|nr:hypothetical protein Salat_1130700 [Sesamum alatum]
MILHQVIVQATRLIRRGAKAFLESSKVVKHKHGMWRIGPSPPLARDSILVAADSLSVAQLSHRAPSSATARLAQPLRAARLAQPPRATIVEDQSPLAQLCHREPSSP